MPHSKVAYLSEWLTCYSFSMAKKKGAAKPAKKPAASAKRAAGRSKAVADVAALRSWNVALAVIFGLQGIFFLILSAGKSWPVVTNFLAPDPLQTAAQGKTVLTAAWHHLFDLNLAYLVGAVLLVSALAYLLVATLQRVRYETDLQSGPNRWRWLQYAVTSSLLIVAVALLAGVQEFALLLALVGLTVLACWSNLLAERRQTSSQQPGGGAQFVLACVSGGLAWLAVLLYLLSGVTYGHTPAADVWIVFAAAGVLFAAEQVLFGLRRRLAGRWADAVVAERSYLVLRLVLVSAVAWVIFAGALKP